MSPNYRKTSQASCWKIWFIRYFEAPNARNGSSLFYRFYKWTRKHYHTRGPIFGPGKCWKIITRWIYSAVVLLVHSLTANLDQKCAYENEMDQKYDFTLYHQFCGTILNCSNAHFWSRFKVRLWRVWTKSSFPMLIQHVILNSFSGPKILNIPGTNVVSVDFGTIKGQQVMMQYIQKGEMALQQGMEGEAINSFSMAACISYIGQGMTSAPSSMMFSTIFISRGNKSWAIIIHNFKYDSSNGTNS